MEMMMIFSYDRKNDVHWGVYILGQNNLTLFVPFYTVVPIYTVFQNWCKQKLFWLNFLENALSLTFWTNKKNLLYNPDIVKSLKIEKVPECQLFCRKKSLCFCGYERIFLLLSLILKSNCNSLKLNLIVKKVQVEKPDKYNV